MRFSIERWSREPRGRRRLLWRFLRAAYAHRMPLRAAWRSRRTRALLLQLLVTSYLAMGLVTGALVTAFDHHGAERNPTHNHLVPGGQQPPGHSHGFQLPHSHATELGRAHAVLEGISGGQDVPTIQSDAPPAMVNAPLLTLVQVVTFAPFGLTGTWMIVLAGTALWAVRPRDTVLAPQALVRPPGRPPTHYSR